MKMPMRVLQIAILMALLSVVPANAYAWQDTDTTAGAGQGGSAETEKLTWRLKQGQKFNVCLLYTSDAADE